MEKMHKNISVFMLSCIKHACFHVFSPFSAYFFPHDIIAEKGPLINHPGPRHRVLLASAVWHETSVCSAVQYTCILNVLDPS